MAWLPDVHGPCVLWSSGAGAAAGGRCRVLLPDVPVTWVPLQGAGQMFVPCGLWSLGAGGNARCPCGVAARCLWQPELWSLRVVFFAAGPVQGAAANCLRQCAVCHAARKYLVLSGVHASVIFSCAKDLGASNVLAPLLGAASQFCSLPFLRPGPPTPISPTADEIREVKIHSVDEREVEVPKANPESLMAHSLEKFSYPARWPSEPQFLHVFTFRLRSGRGVDVSKQADRCQSKNQRLKLL